MWGCPRCCLACSCRCRGGVRCQPARSNRLSFPTATSATEPAPRETPLATAESSAAAIAIANAHSSAAVAIAVASTPSPASGFATATSRPSASKASGASTYGPTAALGDRSHQYAVPVSHVDEQEPRGLRGDHSQHRSNGGSRAPLGCVLCNQPLLWLLERPDLRVRGVQGQDQCLLGRRGCGGEAAIRSCALWLRWRRRHTR